MHWNRPCFQVLSKTANMDFYWENVHVYNCYELTRVWLESCLLVVESSKIGIVDLTGHAEFRQAPSKLYTARILIRGGVYAVPLLYIYVKHEKLTHTHTHTDDVRFTRVPVGDWPRESASAESSSSSVPLLSLPPPHSTILVCV